MPSSEFVEAVEREERGTEDQDAYLHRVVVGYRAHPSERCVQAGEDDDKDRADPETVNRIARDVQLHFREQRAEDHSSGEDADGNFRDDEGDDGDDGKNVARFRAEALFEEFRHGENHGAHVKRHEYPSEHQQAPGMEFVVREGDAAGGACAGQSDNVLRANVGGENRGADNPPAEVAAREEVVGGGIFCVADDIPGDAEQDREITSDHDPVNRGQARLHCDGEQHRGRMGHLFILKRKLCGCSFNL